MIAILVNILIMFCSFAVMEAVAWSAHKFLMHGILWDVHKDHHTGTKGFFQRNDFFFIIFAIPSWLFMMFGIMAGCDYRMWIGIGIAIYGVAYFLVHEVIIHQRLSLFKRSNNRYIVAVRKAHKAHHKHLGKEEGECFGMLLVPFKYFKKQ